MKILHLIDDSSLPDRAMGAYGNLGDPQSFVVLTEDFARLSRKFCRYRDTRIVLVGSSEYNGLLRDKYDLIWVHGASTFNIRFVLSYGGRASVFWSTVGSDYREYLARWPWTVSETIHSLRKLPKGVLKKAALYCFAKLGLASRIPSEHGRFFRRVNYFSAEISADIPLLKGILPSSAEHVSFCYLTDPLSMVELKGLLRRDAYHEGKMEFCKARVEFLPNGGVGKMNPVVCSQRAGIQLPACAFRRPGYRFVGWSYAPNGRVVWTNRSSLKLPPSISDVAKLFAVWKGETCRVKFNSNGGSGTMSRFSFEFGKAARLPVCSFARLNFVCDGWAMSSQKPVHWKDGGWIREPPMHRGGVELFCKWRLASGCYAIRFISNDGTNRVRTFAFRHSLKSGIPTLESLGWRREGFDFVGWSLPTGGKVVYRDGAIAFAPVPVGGTLRVCARWALKPNWYGIRFYSNDGTNRVRTFAFRHSLKSGIPTLESLGWRREGYDFVGWSLPTGGKVVYRDGAIALAPVPVGGTLHVCARWALKPNWYGIRFNSNDGTNRMLSKAFQFGVKTSVPVASDLQWRRTGYDFLGWSTSPNGRIVYGLSSVAFKGTKVGLSFNLYAIWKISRAYYRLVFVANDGTGRTAVRVLRWGHRSVLPSLNGLGWKRKGFVFVGWSTRVNSKICYGDRGIAVSPVGRAAQLTLYARWTLQKGFYGITFSPDGGLRRRIFAFPYGRSASIPTLKSLGWERPEYNFVGWALAGKDRMDYFDGAKVVAVARPGSIVAMHAIWKGRTYALAFDTNGGEGSMPNVSFVYGQPLTLPQCAFTRKWYTFVGWMDNPRGEVIAGDEGVVKDPRLTNGKVVLYAQWRGFDCTLRFQPCGGHGKMDDFIFPWGTAKRLPRVAYTLENFRFAGWSDSPDGEVIWSDGGWLQCPPFREGVATLYAKWKGVPCHVVFDANGGIGSMEDERFEYNVHHVLPECEYENSGHVFIGWSLSKNGPVVVRRNRGIGKLPFMRGDLTLYAQWRGVKGSAISAKPIQRSVVGGLDGRLRILHIIGARLFVDSVITTFGSITETDNRYVLVTGEWMYSTAGIRQRDKLEVVYRHSDKHKSLISSKEFDVVWMHGASEDQIRYCLNCNPKVLVVWSAWGFDYVDYVGRWWFGPRTTLQWLHFQPWRKIWKTIALWGVAKLGVNRMSLSEHGRFFKRVDVFTCVLQEEESLIRKALGFRAHSVFYAYMQKFKKTTQSPKLVNLNNRGVWIGNSATLTNNFWDIYPRVAKTKNITVVSSLVYGPDGITRGPYAESIEECGRHYFGDRFIAISEFLKLEEYEKLMDSCSVFVFGHRRQQAIGNILLALKRGGCVFLDRRSPQYRFCLRKGFRVYTLEDLDRGIDVVLQDFRIYQRKTAIAANKVSEPQQTLAKIRKSVRQIRGECERRACSLQ